MQRKRDRVCMLFCCHLDGSKLCSTTEMQEAIQLERASQTTWLSYWLVRSNREDHVRNLYGSGVSRGGRGAMAPQTFGKCFLCAMN